MDSSKNYYELSQKRKKFSESSANVISSFSQKFAHVDMSESDGECSQTEIVSVDHACEEILGSSSTETEIKVIDPTRLKIRIQSIVSDSDGTTCDTDSKCSQLSDLCSSERPSQGCNNEVPTLSDGELLSDLKYWCIKYNVSHSSFKDLLKILSKHHNLPSDPRTVLGTKSIEQKTIGEGSFIYLGLQSQIIANYPSSDHVQVVKLDINIDGVPIYKSTGISFWPILCSVSNSFPYKACSNTPFIVGIYSGKSKPDIQLFLKEFCCDLQSLLVNGIVVNNRQVPLEVRAIITDAPAKAFIKQVKGHGGYFACDRCIVKGFYDKEKKSMSYNDLNATKRTDNSFRNKLNNDHHIGVSPFEMTNIDMVTTFAIDYMHVICLGMMRKLLLCWFRTIPFKISSLQQKNVEDIVNVVRKFVPSEFNRKPRSFKELDRFKAVEFRLILLYTGFIYFKDVLKDKYLKNFLLLMFIVRTVCDSNSVTDEETLKNTDALCKIFVKQFNKLYGSKLAVGYNVHLFIHLIDDVRKFGVLDSFSAFPFESLLGHIKRHVRSTNLPLAQIGRRLSEGFFLTILIRLKIVQITSVHFMSIISKSFLTLSKTLV